MSTSVGVQVLTCLLEGVTLVEAQDAMLSDRVTVTLVKKKSKIIEFRANSNSTESPHA